MPVRIVCSFALEEPVSRCIDTSKVSSMTVENGPLINGPWKFDHHGSHLHLYYGPASKVRLDILYSDGTTELSYLSGDMIDLYFDNDEMNARKHNITIKDKGPSLWVLFNNAEGQ